MATIENVADMLFSGLTSVAMGSYARTPPQAERTQSHRPQRGELLAEPALNVAGSISFRFHVVCVSYNTHTLQGFSSRTVSLSPHTKRQATSTQRQQKNWGWARALFPRALSLQCCGRRGIFAILVERRRPASLRRQVDRNAHRGLGLPGKLCVV